MRYANGNMPLRFALLALACSLPLGAQVTAIRAGRLIDPETGVARANQVILIEDGKFKEIGAWIIRNLLAQGDHVWVYDLKEDPRRLRPIMPESEIAKVAFVQGDVTDQAGLQKAIAQHQTIQIKLADMATKIEASRLLIYSAAEKRDRGERCDLEAGMAKLFATETAAEVAFEAMRIMGANGYSKDFPVERYYRDAPLVVIGGGTNELQRLIIAKNLLKKYAE